MGWLETYPHSVFASALLSDGKLIAWKVGNPAKSTVDDFYKAFIFAQKKRTDFANITVEVKEYICNSKEDHSKAFEDSKNWLTTNFEPHADHMGALPNARENLFEHIERMSGSPYAEFISSTPDQLAEKLLKASCCYCVFGKGQGMGCRNTQGTDCKAGILAYLTGKTLD